MKVQIKKLAVAIAFLGVIVACVVAYLYAAHDWKAIQGNWTLVSQQPIGRYREGVWSFGDNGLLDAGYRSHYSINPLLHTITWGDSGVTGTYELEGYSLKIWVYENNEKANHLTFERARP